MGFTHSELVENLVFLLR